MDRGVASGMESNADSRLQSGPAVRLDANKIDERIQKLQELKRIAADPELLQMLFEFMDMDEETPARFSRERQPAKV